MCIFLKVIHLVCLPLIVYVHVLIKKSQEIEGPPKGHTRVTCFMDIC